MWSWLFLIFGGLALLGSRIAIRPPKLWWVAIPVFFWGWFASELAVHFIFYHAALALFFVWKGALSDWPGAVGLALMMLSTVGFLQAFAQSSGAEQVLDTALKEGLRERYDPDKLPEQPRITTLQLALPFWTLPRVTRHRDIVFAQPKGIRLKLDIYRTDDGKTRKPVLLQVHGGAWVLGTKDEQGLPLMRYLATRGWICVGINYRLSPRAVFPDHLIDVKQGIAWVRRHIEAYGGDPDHIVITGGSAGGHLCSLAALTANQPEYQPGFESVDTSVKACVPCYGVYDFTDRLGAKSPSFVPFLERVVMQASVKKKPELFSKASPIDQISSQAPAFFILHGRNDSLVPVEEARLFAEKLREVSQAPVVYAELIGAQHAFEIFNSIRTDASVRAIERFLLSLPS